MLESEKNNELIKITTQFNMSKNIYRDLALRSDDFCRIAKIFHHTNSECSNFIVAVIQFSVHIDIDTIFVQLSCGFNQLWLLWNGQLTNLKSKRPKFQQTTARCLNFPMNI